MPSIFTKIVQGEIPSYQVAETEDFLAFLDIQPIARGHTLAIPKQEVDYLFDLPDDLYIGLHVFARKVAAAIERTVPCKRIGTAVIGLEVPHTHIHLVPINHISDLSFEKPKLSFSHEELEQLAQEIRGNL